MHKPGKFPVPEQLTDAFAKDVAFEEAFFKLTPGRQKGYLLYFSQAKSAKTISGRVEKYRQRILDGYGIRDCTCGLSNKKPNCDGSHKKLQSA